MRIVVDPIKCDAHGVCAELLPEMITLDDWGYPIIAEGSLPPAVMEHARRAVFACPAIALRIVKDEQPLKTIRRR